MNKKSIGFISICCMTVAISACSSDNKKSSGGGTPDAGSGGATGSGGASSGGGSSSGGGTASGGTTGTDGGGDAGKAKGSVSGLVVDASSGDATKAFDASKYPALSGVKVCVSGDSTVPCVTTGADGKYELVGTPASEAFDMTFEKTGIASTLYAVGAGHAAKLTPPAMLLTTQAYQDNWITQAGGTPDHTKGGILFGATTLGPSSTPFHEMFGTTELFYLEGYQVSISPAATLGPVYTSASWAPDPSLTKSSAAGWGIFQLPAGDYTLTFTHPNATCGSVKAKVVSGFSTTYVGLLCTLKSTDGGVSDGGPHPG